MHWTETSFNLFYLASCHAIRLEVRCMAGLLNAMSVLKYRIILKDFSIVFRRIRKQARIIGLLRDNCRSSSFVGQRRLKDQQCVVGVLVFYRVMILDVQPSGNLVEAAVLAVEEGSACFEFGNVTYRIAEKLPASKEDYAVFFVLKRQTDGKELVVYA